PGYNWHSNKGYGCPKHLAALREIGPSPLHRRSFAPVAQAELPLVCSGSAPARSPTPPPIQDNSPGVGVGGRAGAASIPAK
ncbi:MAG TPA: hypothetical protein VF404_02265, partial [Sphingomonas sp.]